MRGEGSLGYASSLLDQDKLPPGPQVSHLKMRGEEEREPGNSAPVSPGQAQAYSALGLQPLIAGIENSGEKGPVEGEGALRMAALPEARPRGDRIGVRAGGTVPWSAPGGPASPVPGPGVSKQSRPNLSSASLV